MTIDFKIRKKKLTKKQNKALQNKFTSLSQKRLAEKTPVEELLKHVGANDFAVKHAHLFAEDAAQKGMAKIFDELRSDKHFASIFPSLHSTVGKEFLANLSKPVPLNRMNALDLKLPVGFESYLGPQITKDSKTIQEARELKALYDKVELELAEAKKERDEQKKTIEKLTGENQSLKNEAVVRTTAIKRLKRAPGVHRDQLTRGELMSIIDENRFRNGKPNFSAIGRSMRCSHETAKKFIAKMGLASY